MRMISGHISRILQRGECVQLVSLPGMGASRLVKSLTGFHLDYNLVSHLTSVQLIEIIPQNPVPELITLDPLNRFLDHPNSTLFFNFLKGLRDQNKYRLRYLFVYQSLHPVSAARSPALDSLFSLVSENILYMAPYSLAESLKIIPEFSSTTNYLPTAKQIRQIALSSGGIPALIKIIMQSLRDHTSSDFHHNPRLKAQLEEISRALGENPDLQLLENHGLLDSDHRISGQLLRNYLDLYSSPRLSAAETRLLDLLTKYTGKPVTKDQICEAVYPEVKNKAGISDHAIDQLIHRLREKIKSQYCLQTRRGLGYTLSPL